MTIDPKSQWHARLYRWTMWQIWMWTAGSSRHIDLTPLDRTNVCHYVRVLFVWLPLLVVSHLLLLALVIFVLVIHPVQLVGWQVWGLSVIYLDVGALLLSLVTTAAIFGIHRLIARLRQHKMRPHYHLPNPHPSVLKLALQWLKDRHERICTTIEFRS